MKRFTRCALAGLLTISAGASFASEYADFLRDSAAPYGQYRQSLALTSSKDTLDKAQQATQQFTQGWEAIATRYAVDPPKPFAGLADFPARIKRPVEVGKEAMSLLKEGRVSRAHAVLEEVRYILWDLRVRAGINSIADRANDFHEAMEVILERTTTAKEPEDLIEAADRYGAWFAIKWEELALASDLGAIHNDFNPAFADGRKVVADYLAAMRKGDLAAAKKMSGPIKNAYKKVWALDPQ